MLKISLISIFLSILLFNHDFIIIRWFYAASSAATDDVTN